MTSIQIACFLGVLIFSVLKALSMKPCADKLPSEHTPLFMSFWASVAVAALIPFHYDEISKDFYWSNFALLLGILKGLFFFFYVNTSQTLSKEAASSRAFIGAMAAGIIALVNFSFLKEHLTNYQLISALLMTGLGFIYYFKGHISKTSLSSQKSFIFLLMWAVILSVLDHVALSRMYWFTYLIITMPIMLAFSYFMVKNKSEITGKFFINNKYLGLAAIIYVSAELFLTKVRVSIISVTMSNIAVLMAIPIIMVLMSVIWKESTVKKQSIFGFAVFATGLIALI